MLKITIEGPPNTGKTTVACAIHRLLAAMGVHVTIDDPDAATRTAEVQDGAMCAMAESVVHITTVQTRIDTVEDRVLRADIIAVGKSAAGYNIIKNRFGTLGYVSPKAFDELRKAHPSANILVI